MYIHVSVGNVLYLSEIVILLTLVNPLRIKEAAQRTAIITYGVQGNSIKYFGTPCLQITAD